MKTTFVFLRMLVDTAGAGAATSYNAVSSNEGWQMWLT